MTSRHYDGPDSDPRASLRVVRLPRCETLVTQLRAALDINDFTTAKALLERSDLPIDTRIVLFRHANIHSLAGMNLVTDLFGCWDPTHADPAYLEWCAATGFVRPSLDSMLFTPEGEPVHPITTPIFARLKELDLDFSSPYLRIEWVDDP